MLHFRENPVWKFIKNTCIFNEIYSKFIFLKRKNFTLRFLLICAHGIFSFIRVSPLFAPVQCEIS